MYKRISQNVFYGTLLWDVDKYLMRENLSSQVNLENTLSFGVRFSVCVHALTVMRYGVVKTKGSFWVNCTVEYSWNTFLLKIYYSLKNYWYPLLSFRPQSHYSFLLPSLFNILSLDLVEWFWIMEYLAWVYIISVFI